MTEYPFKDLLPIDEVLEQEGYYKDWTHLDPEVFYSLTQISEYIKTKGYGVDVRLLIAQLAEHFGLKTVQVVDLANLLEQKFENLEGVTQSFTNNINSLVAQMEADKDAVIANATVDSEVILARGEKPTLGARLTEADTRTKSIFDIKTLGIIGDGSIDETAKLQEIVDYSRNEKIKVINYDKNLIINISKPIYFDGGEDIDFGYANINKTTNTVGEGSNLSPNRFGSDGEYFVDEYNVDAHFIFRHKDHGNASRIKTFNIHFGTTAPNTHDFAIFAPRVNRWQIENITATNYRFDKFIFSYSMWHIPKFNNIEYHGGEYLLEIANDGTNKGSSTSINANQLYNQSGKGLLYLYATAYSTFTNVFGDINTYIPFLIDSCQGITINSPEIEIINNGRFAWIVNSSVTFNSPSCHVLKGPTVGDGAFLWNIESSKVVINTAKFPNYSEGVEAKNVRFNVDYGSHVTLNQCKLPKNMSPYRGLSGGSTLTTIDENGVTVQTAEGTGTKFAGRKIIHGDGPPSSGKWNVGDIILFNVVSAGNPIGYYCIRSGEYGVTEPNPSFSELPNTQVGARKERFGTEKPTSGYWRKGDVVINTNPSYDGVYAWICVSTGTAPIEADFGVVRITV